MRGSGEMNRSSSPNVGPKSGGLQIASSCWFGLMVALKHGRLAELCKEKRNELVEDLYVQTENKR